MALTNAEKQQRWRERLKERNNRVKAQWNYLEVGHGKGPCDGLGASVKRAADMAVKQNKCSIQCADDLYRWTLENNSTKIRYISYNESDIEEAKTKLSTKEPTIAVPGTMKIHIVVHVNGTSIYVCSMSCYCKNCTTNVHTTKIYPGWEFRTMVKSTRQTDPKTLITHDEQLRDDRPKEMCSNTRARGRSCRDACM